MDGPPSFGSLLKELRVAQQLSQESLAERARMSVAAISALERGSRRAPYRHSVDLLADGLGVDASLRERLHQLAERPRKARTESRTPARTIGAIPVWLNEFFAREVELEELANLLRERRLVTTTGTGGVGKTRLAAALAQRLAEEYPDGVYFVELAQVTEGRQVAAFIGNTLGVATRLQNSILDELCVAFKNRHALVILDNCEHVRAAVTDLAARLLADCRSLRILATSREPLRIHGEALFVVAPLACGAERAQISPAGRLFNERARDAGCPASLDSQRWFVEELCRALDGLPLAIELAAAHARSFSVEQILEGLGSRLEFLKDVGSARAHRHRTIKATIDWSYALLSEPQKALFRFLAAFPATWPLAALRRFARALDEGPNVVALHASLVDSSLITVVPVGSSYRYGYLETIRAFAAEALASGTEYHMANDAVLSYSLEVARRCADGLEGAEEPGCLEELDVEYPTIRSSIAYASGRPDRAASSHTLVQSLRDYWIIRGELSEGLDWTSKVLRGPRNEVDDATLDYTQLALGGFLRLGGRVPEALTVDAVVVERAQARHDQRLVAMSVANRAGDEYALGNLNDALSSYYSALMTLRQFGDSTLLARVLHATAAVETLLERFADADAHLVEARKIATRFGDQRGLAWVEYRRGFLALVRGDLRNAERHIRKSFYVRQKIDDRPGTASCLEAMGVIKTSQGDYDGAAASFRECIELSRSHGFIVRLIEVAERVAYLVLQQGRADEALSLFAHAAAKRDEFSCPMERLDAADMEALVTLFKESPVVETTSDSLDDMVDEALSLIDLAS